MCVCVYIYSEIQMETNPKKVTGKIKKTMGGARRTMEATPKKPMQPNTNNGDGTTKKTMGGTIRKPRETRGENQ